MENVSHFFLKYYFLDSEKKNIFFILKLLECKVIKKPP